MTATEPSQPSSQLSGVLMVASFPPMNMTLRDEDSVVQRLDGSVNNQPLDNSMAITTPEKPIDRIDNSCTSKAEVIDVPFSPPLPTSCATPTATTTSEEPNDRVNNNLQIEAELTGVPSQPASVTPPSLSSSASPTEINHDEPNDRASNRSPITSSVSPPYASLDASLNNDSKPCAKDPDTQCVAVETDTRSTEESEDTNEDITDQGTASTTPAFPPATAPATIIAQAPQSIAANQPNC